MLYLTYIEICKMIVHVSETLNSDIADKRRKILRKSIRSASAGDSEVYVLCKTSQNLK